LLDYPTRFSKNRKGRVVPITGGILRVTVCVAHSDWRGSDHIMACL